MPSARRVLLAACCLPLAAVATGCETTQETSARLKVRADRILVSREPVEVKRVNPRVRVLAASVLRDGERAAIALTLRNRGRRPFSDLPIAVGVESGGATVAVNRGRSFRYFEAHSPLLPPRGATTWVLALPAKGLPDGGGAVARVGFAAEPPPIAAAPRLTVSRIVTRRGKRQTTVAATVDNESGFPQYDLSIYAWARRAGRYVAAAQKSIGDLGTDRSRRVTLELIGDPGKAKVHVAAPPTIFE